MEITAEGRRVCGGQDVEYVAREAWGNHPLRNEQVDRELDDVMLVLAAGEKTVAEWSDYPTARIILRCTDREVADRLQETLYHELTHIIDRHDPGFMGARSQEDLSEERDQLRAEDPLMEHALVAYWNMYIDGRLSKYDKSPYTFEERVAEFMDKRPESDLRAGEAEAWQEIWNADGMSFDELVSFAKKFPKPETQVEWIRQYYGRQAG